MEARYRCNVDDYVEAQKAYTRKSNASRVLMIMAALMALGALYMVIFVDIYQSVPLVLLAILWVLPKFIFPWKARRDFERHPNLGREYRLRADQEGLHLSSEMTESSTRWAGCTAFAEASNVFLVFTGARTFHIIPKRAFVPAELDEFRQLLEKHLRRR